MLATAFLRAFWFLEKSDFPNKLVILSGRGDPGPLYETEKVLVSRPATPG